MKRLYSADFAEEQVAACCAVTLRGYEFVGGLSPGDFGSIACRRVYEIGWQVPQMTFRESRVEAVARAADVDPFWLHHIVAERVELENASRFVRSIQLAAERRRMKELVVDRLARFDDPNVPLEEALRDLLSLASDLIGRPKLVEVAA